MSYLQRRGGMFWIRHDVPRRLQPILGKTALLVPLRTGDEKTAQARLLAELPRIKRTLADAERALTDPTVASRLALKSDLESLAGRQRTDEEDDAVNLHLTPMEDESPIPLAGALLKRNKVDTAGPPLSVILEKYQSERQLPSRTWQEWQTMWTRFTDTVGDLPVKELRRSHVRDFKDALLKMPRDKRRPDGPRVSGSTVQKHLSAIRSVLAWAVRNDYAESNPAADLRLSMRMTAEKPRLPHDVDALKTLFSSKMYTDPSTRRDARWWLPLLAIFTGARREELGQLHCADVRVEDGVAFIHVRPGDGKKIKTRGSDRRIPLHPELVRLGFLQHVEAMRVAGHSRVFAELRPDPHGRLTDAFGKWFTRYCRSVGAKSAKTCFHSGRHGWIDAAREVMPEEHRHSITGHVGGGVGRTYGRGVPLHVLAESMARVRYRGLDLGHLLRRE